jgi:pimeloyl-ACP methyl ester carboxylesterase
VSATSLSSSRRRLVASSAAAAAFGLLPGKSRPADGDAIRPFRVDAPEGELIALRRPATATPWPHPDTSDRSQRAQLAKIQELVGCWWTDHDWRKVEAKLNALPQFVTEIDGLDIHFIHIRSRHPNALPPIITHGWPGSILELMKVIRPLTDPTSHGRPAEDAFDLVLPSTPGYGFSGKPQDTGSNPDHVARAWAELMNRLGYKRYASQRRRLRFGHLGRYKAARSWCELSYHKLIYFNEVDKGGRYAAGTFFRRDASCVSIAASTDMKRRRTSRAPPFRHTWQIWRLTVDKTETFEEIDDHRRRFFGIAAVTVAAAHLGMIRSVAAQSSKARLPTIKTGTNTSFGSLKQINSGALNVGYAEVGPADGRAVILLHGWPYDIHSYVDVAPLLASAGYRVIVPHLRGYGTTRFLSSETFRNGQQSALALDIIALMDALKIDKAILGGFDWGARTADIVAALRPERCNALVSVSGYLIGNREAGKIPLPPKAELEWWYQYYFATERGRVGYDKYRHDFAKLIWQLASPKWDFDDATFDRTSTSFDNPDHVSIVIHNYRWRLGLAEGESKYDEMEKRLAEGPVIGVPTITLEGDANGAPHAEASSYAKKFSGKYAHRVINGGVGHNLPQEAPQAFAEAIVESAEI